MQLEIEENRQSQLVHFEHTVVAMREDEFQAQLDPADMRSSLARDFERGVEPREIERQIDRISVHSW